MNYMRALKKLKIKKFNECLSHDKNAKLQLIYNDNIFLLNQKGWKQWALVLNVFIIKFHLLFLEYIQCPLLF
jgi:hypothetical protein